MGKVGVGEGSAGVVLKGLAGEFARGDGGEGDVWVRVQEGYEGLASVAASA